MKRFHMIDEDFECDFCHEKVKKLQYSARDHCPFCFYSKHVDKNPGDRSNDCHGLLVPIDIERFKDTYKIVYRCQNCHEIHRNILAKDDSMDMVIELSKKVF